MKLFRRWPTTFALTLLLLLGSAVARAGGHREGIERTIAGTDAYLFYSTNQEPDWHGVAMPAKPTEPVIHWYDKWNPVWWLGNADDPVPPAWYEPDNPHRKRDWFFRNPFTNFTYFVIGVADKDTMRYGRYPKLVGNPHGGWNFAVTRRRIVLLPFWDYKNSRMEFYFGWRERGNFGIKLIFHQPPEEIKP
jgi:hypothetical protein